MSKPGHVTEWHQDFQENFTIQLKGAKRWYLLPAEVKEPVRGIAPHFGINEETMANELKFYYQHQECISTFLVRFTNIRIDSHLKFLTSALYYLRVINNITGESINMAPGEKKWPQGIDNDIDGVLIKVDCEVCVF